MAIQITPTVLPAAKRDTDVSYDISITPTAGEEIYSITITKNFDDHGIDTFGSSIYGRYVNQFRDSITYVSKGSSDLLEDPETVIGTGNMPFGKDVIGFVCDTTKESNVTYTVTVTHDSGTETATITQKVNNDFDGYIKWLKDYLAS
jgi:hypothetical protein